MFPFTNAPRLPNIGLTSTPGASGTRPTKRSRSASVGLGIFTASTPVRGLSAAMVAASIPSSARRRSRIARAPFQDLEPPGPDDVADDRGDRLRGLVVGMAAHEGRQIVQVLHLLDARLRSTSGELEPGGIDTSDAHRDGDATFAPARHRAVDQAAMSGDELAQLVAGATG